MKRIGIFTSGGDSPGMNAAIRAICRACIFYKLEPCAIMRGYQGMIDKDFKLLQSSDVSNIIEKGGTILKSARCKDFETKKGRECAYKNLRQNKIDALIGLGGDGTFRGMNALINEYNMVCVGVPATIDNDIYGTDFTIGYDTAVNTAIEAIDKIRDTAFSHDRVFLVEVMGNTSGHIAIRTGISTGAELVIIPENNISMEQIYASLKKGKQTDKTSFFIVMAEGNKLGSAYNLYQKIQEKMPNIDIRVTVLGHIQRGGAPTARDRMLASRSGIAAIDAIIHKNHNTIVGIVNGQVQYSSFL